MLLKKPNFNPELFKIYHMDLYHAPGGLTEPEIMARIAESIFQEWLDKQPPVCNNGFSTLWAERPDGIFPADVYIGKLVDVRRYKDEESS